MLIHVVGKDPNMRMTHKDIGQLLHLVPAIGSAGRVGRRVHDDPFGLRRDDTLQIFRLQLEFILLHSRDDDRRSATEGDHFRIAHPVGRDADHHAWVQRGESAL